MREFFTELLTERRPRRVHGVLHPRLLDQPLDVGDLGRDGSRGGADLFSALDHCEDLILMLMLLTGIKQKSAVQCSGVGRSVYGMAEVELKLEMVG